MGAIPFHLHSGGDKEDPAHYSAATEDDSDGKVRTEDDILIEEELNHSVVITRETSILTNKEIEFGENFKDDKKISSSVVGEDDLEQFDVEIYLIPDTSQAKLILFYLKERQIPHSIKPLKESDLSAEWFLKISPVGLQPAMKFNDNDVIIESLKIMDFLERNLPVDIFPMAIPCSTSTRSYQKYLFYASLLDTIPMEGLALRAAADEEKIKQMEQLISSLKGEIGFRLY